jgi:hypothetical protein
MTFYVLAQEKLDSLQNELVLTLYRRKDNLK